MRLCSWDDKNFFRMRYGRVFPMRLKNVGVGILLRGIASDARPNLPVRYGRGRSKIPPLPVCIIANEALSTVFIAILIFILILIPFPTFPP